MAKIGKIPEQYRQGFLKLYSLSDRNFKKIFTIIIESPLMFGLRKLAIKISMVVKEVPIETIQEILLSVGSLVDLRDRMDITKDEIVEEISSIIEKDVSRSKHKVEGGKLKFKKRLESILEIENFYITSKSADLLSENENLYLSARIITDIRPVFGENIQENPKAGLIVNVLRIHYQIGDHGEHRDIYIAIDDEDINQLKRIFNRAEHKSKSLNKIITKSEMVLLNPSEKE